MNVVAMAKKKKNKNKCKCILCKNRYSNTKSDTDTRRRETDTKQKAHLEAYSKSSSYSSASSFLPSPDCGAALEDDDEVPAVVEEVGACEPERSLTSTCTTSFTDRPRSHSDNGSIISLPEWMRDA